MSRKRTKRFSGSVLAARTYSDDGYSAFIRSRKTPFKKRDYKSNQLESRYLRALTLIFSGELNDPRFDGLMLNHVKMSPTGEYLSVELFVHEANPLEIEGILNNAEGHFRGLLAESMQKKRIPRLKFIVLSSEQMIGGTQSCQLKEL